MSPSIEDSHMLEHAAAKATSPDRLLGSQKLPQGWTWATLGEATDINGRNPSIKSLSDDSAVTFIPMAAVDAESGAIIRAEERLLGQVKKGFTTFGDDEHIIRQNHALHGKRQGRNCQELEKWLWIRSTELHVFSPHDGILPKWVYYFIRQEKFRADAKANFSGDCWPVACAIIIRNVIPFPHRPTFGTATYHHGNRNALHPPRCKRRRVETCTGQPASLSGCRAQGSVRGAAGPCQSRIGSCRRTRVRAGVHAARAHPGRAASKVAGGAPRRNDIPSRLYSICQRCRTCRKGGVGQETEQVCNFITKGTTPSHTKRCLLAAETFPILKCTISHSAAILIFPSSLLS